MSEPYETPLYPLNAIKQKARQILADFLMHAVY
jgi:hypothetical protein